MPRTIENEGKTYNIYHKLLLDVWGNEEDGFNVNQAFYSYKYLAILNNIDDSVFLSAIECDETDIVQGDDYMLSVDDGKTGKPLYQFCGSSVPDDVTLEDCEIIG